MNGNISCFKILRHIPFIRNVQPVSLTTAATGVSGDAVDTLSRIVTESDCGFKFLRRRNNSNYHMFLKFVLTIPYCTAIIKMN